MRFTSRYAACGRTTALIYKEGVTADLDENGHIIGLEVLDASERLTPDELAAVKYERLRPLLNKKPQPARKRLAKPVKTR